jgi:spore maturation protein SpmB
MHLLSLVLGYLGLLALLRGTWFRGDDFEFLANRVGPDPELSLWQPHNEHWSTGPILIWRALYDLFGMSSVLPYLAASLAAHVLAAHVLWRLMRRAGVTDWISTGLAAAFIVLGAGHENITWAFQLGFMGSLALGLFALLLVSSTARGAFPVAVAAALLSLTFSGIGVILVGMAVLYLLVVRRWRAAALLGVICGGVYVAWYVAIGRMAVRPTHPRTHLDRMAEAPAWGWRAVTSSLEAFFSMPGAGWLLAVAIAGGCAWHLRARRSSDGGVPARALGIFAAFLGGLVAQIGSLAIQRGDISLPDTPRYVYVFVALMLPMIGLALSSPWPRAGRYAAGVVALYLVLTQAVVFLANERPLERPQLQSDVLGMAVLTEGGEEMFPVVLAVDVDEESVGAWADRGDLGDLDAVPPQAVSDVRAQTQVRVTAEPPAAGPGTIDPVGDDVVAGPCLTTATTPGALAATLELTPDTAVSVVAPDGGELAFQVVGTGPASRLMTVPVQPRQTYWFTVAVPLSLDVVAKQGQPLELCAG